MRSICSKVSLFRCWCTGSSCVLYTVWKWNKQVKAALKWASAAFFFFASAESPQAGGQLFTRRESLTHIHRLLTHLAHLYAREKAKKSASLVFGVNTVGSYGSCSSTWAATSPEWNCPLWKASANVYFPSRSAVEFNCGYKGEVGGKQRMWWWWVATV